MIHNHLNRRSLLKSTVAIGAATLLGQMPQQALSQTSTPKRGGVLKVGLGGGSTTDSLDPALAVSTVNRFLPRQWGDTLITLTPQRTVEGRLAESFSSNEDGSEWSFELRQNVKFHDGSTLTAEDVVATYQRHADEASESVVLPLMKGINGIRAEGSTVILSLDTPNADLPFLLADYHLPIQPKGGVDKPDAAIGTGPYKLISGEAGQRYRFEKNMDDWDPERGFYDAVEVLVINDATARSSALQSGQVHFINLLNPNIARRLDAVSNIRVTNTPSRSHYIFAMMIDREPFDNKDLRTALKYAMNREEILDKILHGYGTIGNDIPVNSTYPWFSADLQQRPFDLEKAAEHYKASGHDGSPIELVVADTAFPGAVDMALLFQATCEQAGIPLKVKKVPDDGYWSDVWLTAPFTADNIIGRPVQDQVFSTFFQSGAPWNDSHFSNEEFDRLLLQARGELDGTKRTGLYERMAELLWDEGGSLVPVFADFLDAHSTLIDGWIEDSGDELMNGYVPSKTWFA